MRPLLALSAVLLLAPALARAQYDDPQQPYYDNQQNPQGYQDPNQGYYDQQQQQPQEDPGYAQYANYGVGYVGPHPIPYEVGSGFCYIDGAHTHEYAPFDQHLFREMNGYYYFVGDPVDFGYDRTTYWFNGNHPIPLTWGGGYCYISWPHRHHYTPAGITGFGLVGGYYVYSGTYPQDYYYYRDWYTGYYGNYYRNSYYGNRYYTVRPPRAYYVGRPTRISAPPGKVFIGAPPPVAWRPRNTGYARPAPTPGGPGIGTPRPAPGGIGAPPAYRPAPGSTYAPPPAYRGGNTVAPPPGYRGAAPAPAPVYRGAPAPAPVYRSAPAPAPVYRPAPAPAPMHRPPAPAPMRVAPPPARRF